MYHHWTVFQTVLVIGGLSVLSLILVGSVVTILCVRRKKLGRNNGALQLWNFNTTKNTQQTCPYSENSFGDGLRYGGMPLYNMDNLDFDCQKSNFRNIHLDRSHKVPDLPDICPDIGETEGKIQEDAGYCKEAALKKAHLSTDQKASEDDVDTSVVEAEGIHRRALEVDCDRSDTESGPESDQYASQSDQYGPKSDQYGLKSDQYGPKRDQYGTESGLERDQYGPESDQYGPKSDQHGPESDQSGQANMVEVDLGTPQDTLHSMDKSCTTTTSVYESEPKLAECQHDTSKVGDCGDIVSIVTVLGSHDIICEESVPY